MSERLKRLSPALDSTHISSVSQLFHSQIIGNASDGNATQTLRRGRERRQWLISSTPADGETERTNPLRDALGQISEASYGKRPISREQIKISKLQSGASLRFRGFPLIAGQNAILSETEKGGLCFYRWSIVATVCETKHNYKDKTKKTFITRKNSFFQEWKQQF